MTIEQERDIAVRALNEIAPRMPHSIMAGIANKALADIAAIAAQASPVAQDERSQFRAWYESKGYVYEETMYDFTIRVNHIHLEAYQAGRASVAAPAITIDPVQRAREMVIPAVQPVGEAVAEVRNAALGDLQYLAGFDAGFMAGEAGDNKMRTSVHAARSGAVGTIKSNPAPPVAQDQDAATAQDYPALRAVGAEQYAQQLRDAARYRWLRHGDNDERVIQHGPVAPGYHWLPRNERLDEMIDAAMQAEVRK